MFIMPAILNGSLDKAFGPGGCQKISRRAPRGNAAIKCKINNSNFGPLHETKDLHASPASIGRIKKHKEHKKHKTPQCDTPFPKLPGLIALLAPASISASSAPKTEPAVHGSEPSITTQASAKIINSKFELLEETKDLREPNQPKLCPVAPEYTKLHIAKANDARGVSTKFRRRRGSSPV